MTVSSETLRSISTPDRVESRACIFLSWGRLQCGEDAQGVFSNIAEQSI